MPLIKDIQDKNFVGLKDYVGERIATIIANKIQDKKEDFISKVRGVSEKVEIVIKDTDKDDKDKKDTKPKDKADKDGDKDDEEDDKPSDKDEDDKE